MLHTAQDRHHSYSLFSRLLVRGLTEEDLDTVRRLPSLAQHIPTPFDPDAAAADHQHLFGFNVFPYESVFLDPSGQLGGEVSQSVIHAYQQQGLQASLQANFQIDSAAGSPDHIGPELDFLAFLCQAEASARDLEDEIKTAQHQDAQAAFLDSHLLRWLPPLVLAIKGQEQPIYTALIDLLADLITGHRAQLDQPPSPPFNLPQPPDLLEEKSTRLGQIVSFLLTPAYSAIYLSRDDIGRLARDQTMPRGFGERRQMLLNLFRTTSAYGDMDQLLLSLQELAENWANQYQAVSARRPAINTAEIWKNRAAYTANLINSMRARVADFSFDG